jgi:hypothetical protein
MARRPSRKPLAPDDPRRKGIANLKPIKPGEVRNPTGKNGQEWLTAFRDYFATWDSVPVRKGRKAVKIEGERAELVRRALFMNALAGDTQAQKIITEQLQGRPMQSVEVSGPGGGPIASEQSMTSAERRARLRELRDIAAKRLAARNDGSGDKRS